MLSEKTWCGNQKIRFTTTFGTTTPMNHADLGMAALTPDGRYGKVQAIQHDGVTAVGGYLDFGLYESVSYESKSLKIVGFVVIQTKPGCWDVLR